MIKYKLFFSFEKEENWLNEMAKEGYRFNSKRYMKYYFDVSKPQDVNIRIDYRNFSNKKDYEDYCAMFEDSGWKHISGTKNSGTQYFVKMRSDALNDIFSDQASKAGRYKRLSHMWLTLAIVYFPIMMIYINNVTKVGDLKSLYYTPGLWERSGANFWGAFLFETPFALMRGFIWLVFPIIVLVYLYFAFKSYKTYKKQL